MKERLDKIVSILSDYLTKNEIKCMVLGISGGIDSTVCAAICHEVFNKTGIKLLGYSLMCNTNESDERSAAILAGEFCNEFKNIDINSWYEFSKNFMEIASKTDTTDLARGNIKARLRMNFLYNVAGCKKGIVIDTGNLTEYYTGFWTIHGDVGDISPIGKLWKSEVYELAEYLKDHYYSLSKKISPYPLHKKAYQALSESISLTPTDGNGVSKGGDLEQIAPGYTYEQVDRVLKAWLELGNDGERAYLRGEPVMLFDDIDKDTVKRIIDRVISTRYKRGIILTL